MRRDSPYTMPLFVPASRSDRFEKALQSGADAVILDLEDAVPAHDKAIARASLAMMPGAEVPIIVRVNAISTAWHQLDVSAALDVRPTAVMVPKAEAGAELMHLQEAAMSAGIAVIALIESAQGLADVRAIGRYPGVSQLAFGSIDFCADLGCAHERHVLLAARSEIVLASRLCDLAAPLDGVTTSIDDGSTIEDDARYAASLGFGGKLCIHPKQLPAIQKGFAPTAEELAWAKAVLLSGDGAAAVAGAMVDEPVRIRARSLLERSKKAALT